jgi:predicted nuclease with TOPRIM domain
VAFSVEDFHDLVRLLEQNPEWRAELRRLLLTDAVLNLPALVGELAEAQRRTEEQVAALVEAQRRAEGRLERIDEHIAALAEAQRRAEGRLERVEGRLDRIEEQGAALAEAQRRAEGRLDRIDEHIAALAEAQRRTEEEIRALVRSQQALTGRQDEFAREQQDMRNMLAQLRGNDLERRYRDHADAYFGRLLRRVRVLGPVERDQLFEEGMTGGVLDEDAASEVRQADLIVRGRRPGEDQDTYLVIEVSAVVDLGDVERAARRASLLRRLRPALAVVAGERITPEAAGQIKAQRVWQLIDGRILEPVEP